MVGEETTQREARAREVRHEVVAQLIVGTHRAFRLLFALQAIVAVLMAWHRDVPGDSRVLLTLVLGATLSVPALLFAHATPLAAWVRHWVALSQVGWSMLLLWLLDGRVEAQFHVFVSLAFLALYRDGWALLTGALAAMLCPAVRLLMLPDNYVLSSAAWWRAAEQGTWILAEFLVLMTAVRHGSRMIARFCVQAAELQLANDSLSQDFDSRTEELRRGQDHYRKIAESSRAIPFELHLAHGRFDYIGPQAAEVLGFAPERWREPGFLDALLPREREAAVRRQLDECLPGCFDVLCSVITSDRRLVEMRWMVSCELAGDLRVLRGFMIDVTEARRALREHTQDQKLESVGRIAAGVAHEISSSVQFISDSVRFVRHALRDVPRALADYRALAACALSGRDVVDAARKANETDEAADVDYFLKNAPDALDRALEGIGRVGSVVRSMTEFSHPDSRSATDVDVNRAVRTALNMARNEYKSVADVVTDFGELPLVRCHAGDVSQVVLNLLLNAAQAIADAVAGTSGRGSITVRTRVIGGFVEISITDTGEGIPESVRGRIFEPFVTTRELGRGAGQGLALSRGIVVEKLKGSLHFETETGKGTTFYVRLPVSDTATSADSINKQAAA